MFVTLLLLKTLCGRTTFISTNGQLWVFTIYIYIYILKHPIPYRHLIWLEGSTYKKMNENPKLDTTKNRPSKEKFQTRGVRIEGILPYIDPFTKGVGNLTI